MNSDTPTTGSAMLPAPQSDANQAGQQASSLLPGQIPAPAGQPAPLTPPVKEDDGKLEAAWIEQTKQIIASTRDDPYKQSQALAALKIDYLQKRYNKTVQINT